MAGIARQVAQHNVTINAILPGAFATDRLKSTVAHLAQRQGLSVEQVDASRIASIPARRFGDPDELGQLCAFLASAQAGYITGQNLLIDGGAFPGAF